MKTFRIFALAALAGLAACSGPALVYDDTPRSPPGGHAALPATTPWIAG
jgi:hypothetical protein